MSDTTILRIMFGEYTCILFDSPHLNPACLSDVNLSFIPLSHKLGHTTPTFHANLMKFNKAKCKFLDQGHLNYQFLYNLGDELIDNSPVDKD
ncbi:hypothetical protein HGM15179_015102 [Zosterops borbonicus]|uniref:Uncharacterized protein n=1 Tax=Zosterops borbonicus TaxID=364589 RepID=A0A8K1LFG5_9PASS|nr:hypothetical protein HGM15179_015102 [Zosterops borbonicus]